MTPGLVVVASLAVASPIAWWLFRFWFDDWEGFKQAAHWRDDDTTGWKLVWGLVAGEFALGKLVVGVVAPWLIVGLLLAHTVAGWLGLSIVG